MDRHIFWRTHSRGTKVERRKRGCREALGKPKRTVCLSARVATAREGLASKPPAASQGLRSPAGATSQLYRQWLCDGEDLFTHLPPPPSCSVPCCKKGRKILSSEGHVTMRGDFHLDTWQVTSSLACLPPVPSRGSLLGEGARSHLTLTTGTGQGGALAPTSHV